MIMLITCQV